jgi:hypothetical protein
MNVVKLTFLNERLEKQILRVRLQKQIEQMAKRKGVKRVDEIVSSE